MNAELGKALNNLPLQQFSLGEEHLVSSHALSPCRFKKGFDDEEGESSSGSESGGSENESRDSEADNDKRAQKKQKKGPKLEDLQEMGFRTGPSVLTIKEQPPDASYEWYVSSQQHNSSSQGYGRKDRRIGPLLDRFYEIVKIINSTICNIAMCPPLWLSCAH